MFSLQGKLLGKSRRAAWEPCVNDLRIVHTMELLNGKNDFKLVRSVASWECHVNLKTCSPVTNAHKKIAFEITGGRGGTL